MDGLDEIDGLHVSQMTSWVRVGYKEVQIVQIVLCLHWYRGW